MVVIVITNMGVRGKAIHAVRPKHCTYAPSEFSIKRQAMYEMLLGNISMDDPFLNSGLMETRTRKLEHCQVQVAEKVTY